ncbi:hypothetical protein D3C72_1811040 [compost metagenome]
MHALVVGQVVHDVHQRLLQDRTQATGAGLAADRLAGDGAQRTRADFQLDAFHRQQLLVLLDQRVLGLDQDLHQRGLVQLGQRGDHRQAADQFGDQAELDQVFRLGLRQHFAGVALFLALDLRGKADAGLVRALHDDLLQAIEGAAADEQDIGRVHLQEVLVRMLAATLRRHRCHGAFDQLE